jgi:hypothetical protein
MASEGSFQCTVCGQTHDGLANGFGVAAPLAYERLGWLERRGCKLGEETCVLRGDRYFVRGLVEIPVKRRKTPFVWNVWSTVAPDDFRTMLEHWISDARVGDPPWSGLLANDLSSVYPSTLNLKLAIRSRPVGQRPSLVLEAADHPLAVEQHEGITVDRVREINSLLRHHAAAGSRI